VLEKVKDLVEKLNKIFKEYKEYEEKVRITPECLLAFVVEKVSDELIDVLFKRLEPEKPEGGGCCD
jgi:hypothetical protein